MPSNQAAKDRKEARRLRKKVVSAQDTRDAGFLAPVLNKQVESGIIKQIVEDRRKTKVISSRG